MAFIPVANTAQVEVRCIWDTQRVENTIYFKRSGVWTDATLLNLGTAVRNWWVAHMRPITSTGVTLSSVFCRDLSTATSVQVEVPGSSSGDSTSEAMPNNVSLCISLRTNQAGRSHRGRNYAIGLTVDDVLGNSTTLAYRQALVAAYTELFAVATANASTWVIVSRFTNNAPRAVGITTPVASAQIIDATVDSMRRRLPGRGA